MRVFIAIDIKQEVKAAAAKLQSKIRERLKNKNGIKWVDPENMHLTLKFLGEVEQDRIDSIADAVRGGCGEKISFSFEMKTVGTFAAANRIIWLGCEVVDSRLAGLADDIEKQLILNGFEKRTKAFTAHLTIGRVKDKGINKSLGRLLRDLAFVQIPPVKVDCVGIYKSRLTSDGPIYTLLRKIELKSPA